MGGAIINLGFHAGTGALTNGMIGFDGLVRVIHIGGAMQYESVQGTAMAMICCNHRRRLQMTDAHGGQYRNVSNASIVISGFSEIARLE